MSVLIKVLAAVSLLVLSVGIFEGFLGQAQAETAVQQIYFSVETIKYALVPYCFVKLVEYFKGGE